MTDRKSSGPAASAELVAMQRSFFNSGATRPVSFRIENLKKLYNALTAYEPQILEALRTDLGKSDFESFSTEILILSTEIKQMIKNVSRWTKASKRSAGLLNFPSKAKVYHDPHGVCLIMSPWNYPLQLTLTPLAGAIAAGNTAIIKPSAYSAATSQVLIDLIGKTFPPEYIAAVGGGRDVNQDLLKQHFDYIFFTGSTTVGKFVMESAAKFPTPVTLELGGKSPCIIGKTANIDLSAKRAAWGKCINSGQTCIAPDYFLVHEDIQDTFISKVQEYIEKFYGAEPHKNPEFPHIINRNHFDRLTGLIDDARKTHTVTGGRSDPDTLRIEPAIIKGTSWTDKVMEEEIFGPVIPILTWNDEDAIINTILQRPRPLALYIFTTDKKQAKRFLNLIPFGGGCINDTVMHIASHSLPFGGTGESGIGSYHGKTSFETFSRMKPVIEKSLRLDVPLRYAPFAGKYKKFRKFF
ncbi:aldehyde dehydrogenase [Brucepastera parasyntrophica]|uniref:aldehyde dehydrogenase n=1 Tax=Brucepastera parasyntrophica TaxID=2880008 RepID=UPI00210A720D|nr:aldehyde dehydrogenase [Brucepastera parasyntrophica]ULQ58835.1 aldehyde dehydrogenase [Brucepastera parasyntrophica]